MVQSSAGGYGSSQGELGRLPAPPRSVSRSYKVLAASIAASLVVIVAVAVVLQSGGRTELLEDAQQKALGLELSKQNYDSAKERVKKLHSEFDELKKQLADQVKTLQSARGDLVSKISDDAGVPAAPLLARAEAADRVPLLNLAMDRPAPEDTTAPARSSFNTAEMEYKPNDQIKALRDSAVTIAAAGEARDASDAATHALSYTQQVATRVGDLADQSEEQARRIVDAARLAQEAKEAMRAALEQSSKIVDYNTHAAQAVAQDSGFVTTAAQTISGYLHNIFHDSRAVHAAAMSAVKHMNADVNAADKAVQEIETDAQEAYQILDHIHSADTAATGFAQHARAAAITAATAANGALKGERAAMVGGLKAIASAHSAQAGAQAAMEYAKAAQAAVHPYIDGGFPQVVPGGSPFQGMPVDVEPSPQEAPSQPAAAEPAAEEPAPAADSEGDLGAVSAAKVLVDSVVVLMQQLTNALQSADNCEKVQEILTYYSATMAQFQSEGQELAGKLSVTDMGLLQQYAQSQVASFAGDLEAVVKATSEKCSIPVEKFIPDAVKKPAAKSTTSWLAQAQTGGGSANAVEDARIKRLVKKLAKIKREGILQKVEDSSVKKAPVTGAELEAAVAHEAARVQELKSQIAELQQEKARLTSTL